MDANIGSQRSVNYNLSSCMYVCEYGIMHLCFHMHILVFSPLNRVAGNVGVLNRMIVDHQEVSQPVRVFRGCVCNGMGIGMGGDEMR